MEQNTNTYTIYQSEGLGKVKISDDVIAIIAGVAATDVEGVGSIGPAITRDTILKSGVKKIKNAVNAEVVDNVVTITISANLEYGTNVLNTSRSIQEKIKYQIEGMTGLEVGAVNVKIASVDIV